ncbi:MAG: hypothetical protein IK121_11525 [Lachnospiraceae bacterium]|nr:hypothetical protein [Lachnospiraceae bacterium]
MIKAEGIPSALSDGEDEKLSFKERRELKKELKKARKEKFKDLIGTDEYEEKDFNPEEIEDIKASASLNSDSFYDALDPIDIGEPKDKRTIEGKKILIFAGLVVGLIIVSALAMIVIIRYR